MSSPSTVIRISLRSVFLIFLVSSSHGTKGLYAMNQQLVPANPQRFHTGLHRYTTSSPPPADSAQLIKNFIAAETRFRATMLQFSFKRDVLLQTIGTKGEVTGEYIRSSSFVLNDRGQRIEQVFFHPPSTVKSMKITKEDVQDLAGSQLFGLEPNEMSGYNFTSLSEERLHGRPVFTIDVSPKQAPDPHQMRARFFVGKIWIDADSYQIVKLQGITEPQGKQRFPNFETERSVRVDGLLFPTKTFAADVLRFPHTEVHYRIAVRYYDFKRFASEAKILEVEELQEQ